MTVRLAAVLAVILSAIGIGIIYGTAFMVSAVLPDVPDFAGFLLRLAPTMVGMFLIVLGVGTFYATYLTNRSQRNGEEQR